MQFFLILGGDTIRQLQVQSGAHIELHRGTHPNPAEKLFNIRGKNFLMVDDSGMLLLVLVGSPQAIANAQHLLSQKIEVNFLLLFRSN